MKALWDVIVNKSKEVESNYLLLGVGIFGVINLLLFAIIITKFFKMIVDIVQLVTANPGVGN
jgi:hypothetical protein